VGLQYDSWPNDLGNSAFSPTRIFAQVPKILFSPEGRSGLTSWRTKLVATLMIAGIKPWRDRTVLVIVVNVRGIAAAAAADPTGGAAVVGAAGAA
jgi:hypothetical protein